MAELKEIQQRQEAEKIFEELKIEGSRYLKEGKIDAKTYYEKVRNAGVELGIIGENEYPGRLPKWVEPTLQVIGGIGGAIGGGLVAGPPGAIVGAGGGSATASLATDFLGDLLSPDMPSPSAGQRLKDAAVTGAIDTGVTAATFGAGKVLSPALKKAIEGSKNIGSKIKSSIPSSDKGIGVVEKGLGITEDAASKAATLGSEGIELSLGQATSNPLMQGAYNLTSRMPIVGTPGRTQLENVYAQVNNALNKRISPLAKAKPLTESERSELIKKVGLENFNTWRNSYSAVYKKADQLNKAKGDFFDTSSLVATASRYSPKSKFTDVPADLKNVLDDILLYGSDFSVGPKGLAKLNPPKKLNFNDVDALDTRLSDLAKKYDPASSSKVPNNYAYRTANALLDTMKRELRKPNDQAGRLRMAADKMFKNYMGLVENQTGRQFQKTLGRGSLRPGIGRPATDRLENLYAKTFGENKSPEAVRELRNLIGDENVNKLAGTYLDDIFKKYIKPDGGDFNKLYDELGLSNPRSLKYEATEELLKTYKHTNIDDLSKFLGALREFPEVLPDVNTFIMRSGILRASSSVTPGVIAGATGAGAGPMGIGLLYGINKFLSIPFNKNLVREASTQNKSKLKELIERFRSFLPEAMQELPQGVTPGILAAQPISPAVEEGLLSTE